MESKTYNVILLQPWGQYKCGDIAKVSSGLFFTMMNLGTAIQLEEFENGEDDLDDYDRMVIHSKILIDDNTKLVFENDMLTDKVDRLTEKVEELKDKVKIDPMEEKRLFYKNKMQSKLTIKNGQKSK